MITQWLLHQEGGHLFEPWTVPEDGLYQFATTEDLVRITRLDPTAVGSADPPLFWLRGGSEIDSVMAAEGETDGH